MDFGLETYLLLHIGLVSVFISIAVCALYAIVHDKDKPIPGVLWPIWSVLLWIKAHSQIKKSLNPVELLRQELGDVKMVLKSIDSKLGGTNADPTKPVDSSASRIPQPVSK